MAKIMMANVLLTGTAKDAFGSTLVRAAVPHPEDSPAVDEALYNSAIEALNNRFIPLDGLGSPGITNCYGYFKLNHQSWGQMGNL
jgi:hypothetical protein